MECRSQGSNQLIDEWANAQALPITAEQAAWLAGFSDAEASFMMLGAKTANLVYALYNNNEEMLKYAQSLIGGALREVTREQRSTEHHKSFILRHHQISGTCSACLTVLPYLFLKKPQCEILLHAAKFKPEERLLMRERIQVLNAKGVQVDASEYGSFKGGKRDLTSIRKTDWAYLAGWLDGDGCFIMQPQYFVGTKYLYPWIVVCSSKLPVLKFLQGIFGGNLKVRKQKENWAPKGELVFQDQNYVYAMLPYLIPYLQGKKTHAQVLLDSQTHVSTDRQDFCDTLKYMNKEAVA